MSVATANPWTTFSVLGSAICLLLAHVAIWGFFVRMGLLLRLVVVKIVVDQVSILKITKPATVLAALGAHLMTVGNGGKEVVRRELGLVWRLAQI